MAYTHTNLCFEIAKLVELGRPFPQVLRIMANSQSRKLAQSFQRALTTLQNTGDLGKALHATGLFQPFEIELCKLGDRNGRLALFWSWIANYQDKQANHGWTLFFCLIYPLLLLHFTLLLPTLLYWGQSTMVAYLENILFGLLIVDCLLALVIFLGHLGGRWGRSLWYFVVLSVPLLRRYAFKYQLMQTVTVFQALYGGGMPANEAWETSASVPNHPKLVHLCKRVSARLQKKINLSEAVACELQLPEHLRNFVSVGESSRQLDRILLKAKDVLEREANMALYLFVIVVSCVFALTLVSMLVCKFISWM